MRFQYLFLTPFFLLAELTQTLATEPPEFNTRVMPVFRKYCISCHNSKDAEGGLVLQDYSGAMKGGESGVAIVGGQIGKSQLWKRVTASDDTRMPPINQPAPSTEELNMIRTWIESGASGPSAGLSLMNLQTPKVNTKRIALEPITSMATSPDGRWIGIARPHSVEILSTADRSDAESKKVLTGCSGTINEISFSPNGEWLCIAAGEPGLRGEATLWRTSDWSIGPIFQGHRDSLYSARMNGNGTMLATASYDRDVMTWDTTTGQPLNTLRGHNDAVHEVSFSANGKFLVTASGDRTVKLWNVAQGIRLDTFAQPSKDQLTVAFSPDDQFVVAGGIDCRIRVWQISETAIEGTNPILFTRFAHEGPILKLVFSPDGRLLASSSEDRRVKVWETKTFTQVAVLERQSDWAPALAFTADNRTLLVGRMNGESQFYEVDPDWHNTVKDFQPLNESISVSEIAPSIPIPFIMETEPNNIPASATNLATPGTVRGELKTLNDEKTDVDIFRFRAGRGEQFVIETNAARSGSLADTRIEVLHSDGRPVMRALLQAVRDSWINFRPIDSSSADVRLEFWEEMDLNQLLYMNGEVCKTFRSPQGPDSGFKLYSFDGKRRNYFDTSAAGHAKDEPAYIVEAFAPTSKIVDNGLPVFPIEFENDDDGNRFLGKDSRLTFTAPADGDYLIRVADVRGFSGDNFFYTLTIRKPRPDFQVSTLTTNPVVPAGSGQRLKFTLNRMDGYDGPVRIDLAGLPSGFTASSPVIFEAGLYETYSVITASPDAINPEKEACERVAILATAEIDGRLVTRSAGGLGEIKLEKPASIQIKVVADDVRFTSTDQGLVIEPGTSITAKIVVQRNGFDDDIRFDIDNLPHGVIVDNIGLSGVLVRKQETERQIILTARPWVPDCDRLIHAVSQGVGNQTSPSIPLHVRRLSTAIPDQR